ncbi:hypothetical protein OUHCRE3_57910 [Enterobacter hormaechei]
MQADAEVMHGGEGHRQVLPRAGDADVGQAAFLFLLTSSIAPLVRLSYGRMVWMALPYTLVMGGLGWWAVSHWL